jgi:hypothetical protein
LILVTIVIVVVIVPIAFFTPPASVFIPPAMTMFPAIRAGLPQFVPPVFGFRTFPAVAFRGAVEITIGFDDALLAIIRKCSRCACEKHKSR